MVVIVEDPANQWKVASNATSEGFLTKLLEILDAGWYCPVTRSQTQSYQPSRAIRIVC